MRRLGGALGSGSIVGGERMTNARLRALIESEDTVRSLVYQLNSVGRDVRSSTMHWSYERKKVNCAVKYLAWLPPWVAGGECFVPEAFMKGVLVVEDGLGRGRIPAAWWTQNCKYNAAYDIHRLNDESPLAQKAVDPKVSDARGVRFAYIRDNPDIAMFMIALRTELNMRIMIPAVLPGSKEEPVLSFARFEAGDNSGNSHHHGVSYAKGNPRVGWFRGKEGEADDVLPEVREAPKDEENEDDAGTASDADDDVPLLSNFWPPGRDVDGGGGVTEESSDRIRAYVTRLLGNEHQDRVDVLATFCSRSTMMCPMIR